MTMYSVWQGLPGAITAEERNRAEVRGVGPSYKAALDAACELTKQTRRTHTVRHMGQARDMCIISCHRGRCVLHFPGISGETGACTRKQPRTLTSAGRSGSGDR